MMLFSQSDQNRRCKGAYIGKGEDRLVQMTLEKIRRIKF